MIQFKEHASTQFDNELHTLFKQLDVLKSYLHKFIALVIVSVEDGSDRGKEAKVIDKAVNDLEFEIDQQVMRVISKYSPMMDELRMVLAVIKIAGACESAADSLKNTVKRVGRLKGLKELPQSQHFLQMLDRVATQFDTVLERFSELEDADMAKILAESESLHELYQDTVRSLKPAENTIGMSFILRNTERVSELAYDIAKIGYAARHNRKYTKPDA